MSAFRGRCQDEECSHYGELLDDDFKCLGHDISATSIKETIIDLTDRLDTEEELWDSWTTLNKALSYLSAKHTMARVKEGGDK